MGFLMGSVCVGEVLKVIKHEGGWRCALRGGRYALVEWLCFLQRKKAHSLSIERMCLWGVNHNSYMF